MRFKVILLYFRVGAVYGEACALFIYFVEVIEVAVYMCIFRAVTWHPGQFPSRCLPQPKLNAKKKKKVLSRL